MSPSRTSARRGFPLLGGDPDLAGCFFAETGSEIRNHKRVTCSEVLFMILLTCSADRAGRSSLMQM